MSKSLKNFITIDVRLVGFPLLRLLMYNSISGHPAEVYPASTSPSVLITIMEYQSGLFRIADDR